MIKQNLFYIFKFKTSRLLKSKLNLNITINDARESGELIAIGDNQILRFLRDNNNIDNLKLTMLYNLRDETKELPSSRENSKKIYNYQEEIDNILFVQDIVNVVCDDKQVYKHICKNGFFVNNIKFKRLCSGAGQSRRNTATFVDINLYDNLHKKLMCGLKIKKINVAKFNCYYGLHMSSTLKVTEPRVCLVNDCDLILKNKKVDWIYDAKNKDGKEYRDIEEKVIDYKINAFDGQGLISPKFAEVWKNDLQLDYLPSNFGIRTAFIKGMLITYPIHEFAEKVAETDKIVDYFGKEHNINDIDVILSVSQFKMYKYYKSWDEYLKYHKLYNHSWGVTKVNPKIDDDVSLLNYQYIQTLDLNKESIKQLAQYTINWIDKICSGNKLYSLLYLLGQTDELNKLDDIVNKTKNNFVKAIIYNDKVLQDPYIKRKIYKFIEKSINDAKIGRLLVDGNYQAMVSDPYAQAQHVFKLPITGLLNEFEHYSQYWNNKNIKHVDACRSPLVHYSEHNLLNFCNNEAMSKWYKYINSGIIYNVWGMDTVIHSDSDWDFDIIFTTSNDIIINSIVPNTNPITYEKLSAPQQTLNDTNIYKTDLRSFDCKVGIITNYSTSFISMLPKFKKDSEEYKELNKRLKLLRRYIGDSIDQAKGIKMKPFPREWKSWVKVNENDSDDIKKQKWYLNSLVVKDKKPYFMIYIYEKYMNKYIEQKTLANRYCLEKFGKNIKEILFGKNLYPEEQKYKRDYEKKSITINSNCIINQLCWLIESLDFKYKFSKDEIKDEIINIYKNKNIKTNYNHISKLKELHNEFNRMKNNIRICEENNKRPDEYLLEEEIEEKRNAMEFLCEIIKNKAFKICSNKYELINNIVKECYENKNRDKIFLWSVFPEELLDNIIINKLNTIELPIKDDYGNIEYLGNNYSMKEVIE